MNVLYTIIWRHPVLKDRDFVDNKVDTEIECNAHIVDMMQYSSFRYDGEVVPAWRIDNTKQFAIRRNPYLNRYEVWEPAKLCWSPTLKGYSQFDNCVSVSFEDTWCDPVE